MLLSRKFPPCSRGNGVAAEISSGAPLSHSAAIHAPEPHHTAYRNISTLPHSGVSGRAELPPSRHIAGPKTNGII